MKQNRPSKSIKKPKKPKKLTELRGRPQKRQQVIPPLPIPFSQLIKTPEKVMEFPEFYLIFKLALNVKYKEQNIYLSEKGEKSNKIKREKPDNFKFNPEKRSFRQFLDIIINQTENSLPLVQEFKELMDFAAFCFVNCPERFVENVCSDQRMKEILKDINEQKIVDEIMEIFIIWKTFFNSFVKI